MALQLNLDANLTMTQTPGDGSGNSNSNDGHVRGDFSYTKSLYNNTDGACSGRDQVFQMEARGTFYQLPRSDGTGLIDVAFHVNVRQLPHFGGRFSSGAVFRSSVCNPARDCMHDSSVWMTHP